MHAHINIWRMNESGQSSSDTVARDVAERLLQQPGFHSYTLVRTGEQEVVAITLFETPAQLHAAVDSISDLVRENLDHLADGKPETRAGDVILHEMTRG